MSVSGKPSPFQLQQPKTATPSVAATWAGPVRMQSRLKEMPLPVATGLSVGVHVLTPVVMAVSFLLILILLSWLMNFNWMDWLKPKPRQQEMVFTLIPDTQAERPDKARFKAAFNQIAGGEHDPNREIAPVETPSSTPQQAAQPQQPIPQPTAPLKPQPQVTAQKPTPKAPEPKKTQVQPVQHAMVPVPTIPIPKAPSPNLKPAPTPDMSDGPVVSSSPTTSSSPAPISIGGSSLASASSTAGRPGLSSQLGEGGSAGNPEAGHGSRPGVNAQQDIDYGPFMAELERRIKRNWSPPRAGSSKRVKLRFLLARDGRLLDISVLQSSGETATDEAAIKAVKLSAPFRNIPPQVRDETLPIEFTFDYNVFNPAKQAVKM